MGRTFYQIEIIVSGGPLGYRYEDNYETNVGTEISEVISQGYHLNASINEEKEEKFERTRKIKLHTYIDGKKNTRDIKLPV